MDFSIVVNVLNLKIKRKDKRIVNTNESLLVLMVVIHCHLQPVIAIPLLFYHYAIVFIILCFCGVKHFIYSFGIRYLVAGHKTQVKNPLFNWKYQWMQCNECIRQQVNFNIDRTTNDTHNEDKPPFITLNSRTKVSSIFTVVFAASVIHLI